MVDLFEQNSAEELNSFINELNEPKREFPREPEPVAETEQAAAPATPKKDPEQEKQPKNEIEDQQTAEDYKKVGKAWFSTINFPMNLGVMFTAGEYNESLHLPPKMKQELIDAWADMAEASGWKKPPAGLTLFSAISGTYAPLFWQAWQIRRERNKQKHEQQQERQRQAAALIMQQQQQNKPAPPVQPATAAAPVIKKPAQTITENQAICPKCGKIQTFSSKQYAQQIRTENKPCKDCR